MGTVGTEGVGMVGTEGAKGVGTLENERTLGVDPGT